MTTTPPPTARGPRLSRPGPALFLCLLAGQAALLVLSPVLADIARDLGASPGAAGQLRSVSAAVAVTLALGLGRIVRRLGARDVLLTGLALLAAGAPAGAAAPSLAALAGAQVLTGAGLALVLSGGLAAAAEWAPPERRRAVLSSALLGQPVAWVACMPLVGLAGDAGWRWALLVPLAPALAAAATVARRPPDRRRAAGPGPGPLGLLRAPRVARWALGELLAYTAWCGTLVYAGSLMVEAYGASTAAVGLALAAAGAAYIPGNLLARGRAGRRPRALVVGLAAAGAPLLVLLGALRPGMWASAALLCALAFLSGGRTMGASALGLAAGRDHPLAAMGLRTAAVQGGYLAGAALGGMALTLGGAAALGAALGAVLALAAVVHGAPARRRAPSAAAAAPAAGGSGGRGGPPPAAALTPSAGRARW